MVISLAGCDILTPNPEPIPTQYHGSTGLSMEFHPSSPPSSVNPGRGFKIIINLVNQGASDITDGIVYLTNIVEDDLTIEGSRSKPFTLYGRTENIPAGERGVVSWDVTANAKETVEKTKISAAAEYSYTTNSVTSLCIDPKRDTDTGISNIGKACKMETEITLTDQGAPVAVKKIITSIDQDKKEILFAIGVQNVGGGFVSAGSIGSTALDQLDAEVKLAGQTIPCESTRIGLEEGLGEIICTGKYTQETAYTTTLQINLDYVYRQTLAAKEIEIKKSSVIS